MTCLRPCIFLPKPSKETAKVGLASEQIKRLAVRCIQPAFLAFIFLLLPLLLWIAHD